ncbi:kinesin family protein, putative, partial [Ichthyophthirius multifiliis]
MLQTEQSETTQSIENFKNFQVYVRIKPQQEDQKKQGSIVKVIEDTIILSDPEYKYIDQKEKQFQFDCILNQYCTNQQVFERSVLPSLSVLLQGYNATFFAYGITGSGKTHTIFGKNGGLVNDQVEPYDRGICYMAIEHVLNNIDMTNTKLKFSYLEIYNENVRDLLNGQNNLKNLNIIEDPIKKNIYVQDLKEYQIFSIQQIQELIQEGNSRRSLACTFGNQFSSRSHAILIFNIVQKLNSDASKPEETIFSKLTIIDLAGSEKMTQDKQAKGILEGSNINKSLLALGNCINILSDRKKATGTHIPYRDSKLTRILKDSLGGNTKTIMIACISQNYLCIDETLNTLTYAQRATNIKRKIIKNIQIEYGSFEQMEYIKSLEKQVCFYKEKMTGYQPIINVSNQNLERKEVEEQIKEIEKQLENCQDSEEEFLNRLCNDLYQNIEENYQLVSSLKEIDQILVQDYAQLDQYQKSQNMQHIVEQIQSSI